MKKNKVAKKTGSNDVAFEQVRKFYDFMNTNKLETIEFSKNDVYIKLVRKHEQALQIPVPVFAPDQYAMHPAGPTETHPKPKHQAHALAPYGATGETIKAPMSGIFYRAPSPSSPPYAREGDVVKKDQIICVIEAMKVFNEIKADFDCTILKVLVENGKPVETNQDLFVVSKK